MKNTIKKITTTSIATIALLYSLNASSFAVTDPGSYMYYMQQLKAAAKEIQQTKAAVNEAKTLNKSFNSYTDDLRKKFDLASALKKTLGADIKNYEKYASGLSKKSKFNLDYSKHSDDLEGVINANIEGIFVDPNDERFKSSEIQKLRTFEQQRLRKKGLIETEKSLVGVGARLDRIKDLTDKANNTKSIKMSQDLTNTILLELLATNNEMLKIFSTLGQAEMASKYINYSKEEHEKALNEKQLQEKNTANWKDHYWEWQAKCRENNWSGTFFGKDCPDTSWKKNEKKRGDHQPILDKYGI
jgi:hypothetical protein